MGRYPGHHAFRAGCSYVPLFYYEPGCQLDIIFRVMMLTMASNDVSLG